MANGVLVLTFEKDHINMNATQPIALGAMGFDLRRGTTYDNMVVKTK